MNTFLLDTNIILLSIRGGNDWADRRDTLGLNESANFISVVTLGELWSLSHQNNWGDQRVREMEKILIEFIVIDINSEVIIQRYAEIDAFSQNKLKGKPLGNTSRNMGKNDLWIAASASALGLILLTTDRDFDHLSPDYLTIVHV